jgi:hypothetical protein
VLSPGWSGLSLQKLVGNKEFVAGSQRSQIAWQCVIRDLPA